MILPTRLFFLLFQFLLIIPTLSATQPKLPSWTQIDEMYSKLFGLPVKKEQTVDELTEANVPKELDQNLIFEIEASVIAYEIEEILRNANNESLTEEQNKILEKKRKNFKEFFYVGEEKRSPTMSRVCESWKFCRQIVDEFAKHNLLDGQRKKFNEKRKIIAAPKKINCSKIEQLINEKLEWIQVYLEDIVALHLSVLKNLAMKKYDDNGQKREFSKLFEPEMMPNESNFVFQLRLLHVNANSAEILGRIKRMINQLLIGIFVDHLEIYAPANFAPEIVDDQYLAEAYMEIIFKNDQMASIKKQILDMRIYLGRIWHILGAFYRHKKAGGNISEKDNEFLNERSQKFFSLNEIDNRFPLAYCHDTWYRMAKLYNEIIAIGGTEENGEKKAIEIKNGDAQTIEAMRNEIIEGWRN